MTAVDNVLEFVKKGEREREREKESWYFFLFSSQQDVSYEDKLFAIILYNRTVFFNVSLEISERENESKLSTYKYVFTSANSFVRNYYTFTL